LRRPGLHAVLAGWLDTDGETIRDFTTGDRHEGGIPSHVDSTAGYNLASDGS
jgi:hypothetical protein